MRALDAAPVLQQLTVDVAAGRLQPVDMPAFHRHLMPAPPR